MKKCEYIKMLQGIKPTINKVQENHMSSVTDPTFAQSGRELVFNPLPYETKQIYSNGIPLEQMQPFDAMYADKFDSFEQARQFSESNRKDIKEKLKTIKENESKTKVTE